MKANVNVYQFRDAFHAMGRKDQFSYDALGALFDYLEELESDLGEEIELDVIALCCEYAEYPSAIGAVNDYSDFDEPARDDGESDDDYAERLNDEALDWLRDRTTVIEFDSGIIIEQF